jgi:hypothetical protein
MKQPKNFIERITKNRKVLANGKVFLLEAHAMETNRGVDYTPLWVFGEQPMNHCLLIKLYWEASTYAVVMPKTGEGDSGPLVTTGQLSDTQIQSFDHFKTIFLQPLIEQRMKGSVNKFD